MLSSGTDEACRSPLKAAWGLSVCRRWIQFLGRPPQGLPQGLHVLPLGGLGADAHAQHLLSFEHGRREVGLAALVDAAGDVQVMGREGWFIQTRPCLLYTSDAADEE